MTHAQEPVGMGFLAQGNIIITCAHVVAAALQIYPAEQLVRVPQDPIRLDFPLLPNPSGVLTASVITLEPFVLGKAGDIACLRLHGNPPPGAQAAPIVIKTNLWQREFRAFGVPQGYDDGVWSDGIILGRQSTGYFLIQNPRQTGYLVQPGFSGGPIWVDQYAGVVGMVTLSDPSPKAQSSLAIPGRMLLQELNKALQSPSTSPHSTRLNTMATPPVQAPPAASISVAPQRLAAFVGMNPPQIQQLLQTYIHRANHAQADEEDILAAALASLYLGDYATAQRLLQNVPMSSTEYAYATYAQVIALLGGKRPARHDARLMAQAQNMLLQSLQMGAEQAHAHALLYFIKQDYYKRYGFRIDAPDMATCWRNTLQHRPNPDEFKALATLVSGFSESDLYPNLGL